MLDPSRAATAGGDFIDRIRQELFVDRVYALTPRGEVIDLPRGATPLDFAYHVHTQLGHGCRGARVNGRITPLNQPLANGEIVEVITGRSGGPSRDWLAAESGFLASSRSRAKVRAWFHQLDTAASLAAGGSAGTGAGAGGLTPAEPLGDTFAKRPKRSRSRRATAVDIEGVGDMPTTMARCCAPMPPEAIAGYLTLGRGVTVHAAGCSSLTRMRALHPERVLRVDWNRGAEELMPVQIRVEAFDRRGLLRDVSDAMALERLSIDSVNSFVDPADRVATINMRTAVRDAAQLRQLLKRLGGINSVLRAQRAG
jgi:GTP pyrophosphokinase